MWKLSGSLNTLFRIPQQHYSLNFLLSWTPLEKIKFLYSHQLSPACHKRCGDTCKTSDNSFMRSLPAERGLMSGKGPVKRSNAHYYHPVPITGQELNYTKPDRIGTFGSSGSRTRHALPDRNRAGNCLLEPSGLRSHAGRVLSGRANVRCPAILQKTGLKFTLSTLFSENLPRCGTFLMILKWGVITPIEVGCIRCSSILVILAPPCIHLFPDPGIDDRIRAATD